MQIPCGQCRFCRLEHSRQWAIRAMHEASLYENNCFLTLTYDEKNVPRLPTGDTTLNIKHAVQFMKDLRRQFGEGIRSYGCAEYGEQFSRPHFHICLFNFDFTDKKFLKNTGDFYGEENKIYTSKNLEDLWPYGHSSIGALTFESAAYVARYVTKKITGRNASAHYERIDQRSGEVSSRVPERSVCVSRMPGLGRPWFEQNFKYILAHDFIISRGKKMKAPKYYDRLLEKFYPEDFKKLKEKRKISGQIINDKLEAEDREAIEVYFKTHDYLGLDAPKTRLQVMEIVQEAQTSFLKRNLENA